METSKTEIWDCLKSVPKNHTKKITGGRLKGMTDIKPQWRLQKMTEQFGPCGIGWFYEITDKWIEQGANEVSVYVQINLYVKVSGEWSKGVPGIGGSKVIASEKAGLHHSDESYKMALTDAISVSTKQLGLASDIYMGHDPVDKEGEHIESVTNAEIDSLKKIKDFYNKRNDLAKVEFIDSMLAGENLKHINRVFESYKVDSVKKVFKSDDKSEIMEEIDMENEELY